VVPVGRSNPSRILRLALLAPKIVEAILGGRTSGCAEAPGAAAAGGVRGAAAAPETSHAIDLPIKPHPRRNGRVLRALAQRNQHP
jgi:hypothetical protein